MEPGAHQAGARVEQLSPDLSQIIERLSGIHRYLRPGLQHRLEELAVDFSRVGFCLVEQPRSLVDQLVSVPDQQQLLLDPEREWRLCAEVVLPEVLSCVGELHADSLPSPYG